LSKSDVGKKKGKQNYMQRGLTVFIVLVTILMLPNGASAELVLGPNGHTYEVVIAPSTSVGDANAAATGTEKFGVTGHLATITSLEEDLFLDSIRAAAVASAGVPAEFWVGGFQVANSTAADVGWYWTNGEGDIIKGVTYTNWLPATELDPAEPNDGWAGIVGSTPGIEDNEENQMAIGLNDLFGWNDEFNSGSGNIGGYIVEYDTSIATRVTGGGWIDSPEGAFPEDPDLTDKANFGFVAMSQKDEAQPKGQIEFQVGDLNFHSGDYDVLVVKSDGIEAEFSGSGKLNGEEGYSFKAWVSDDKSDDTLHIIILDGVNLIYDSGDQPLSGGNITIHIDKPKK
jgi:hypothetical protein